MTENSTLNQLTLHLYNETSPLERLEIENLLEENPDADLDYKQLQKAKEALPAVLFSPSEKSVRNILRFASGRQQHCLHLT